jgi:hypothetical protein
MVGIDMRKKGQVTIFIVVGIVIVVAVLIFYLWAGPTYFFEGRRGLNFEGCVEDVVEQAIAELELRAGFINPGFSYSYMGEELTYLCYTNEFYETCTVQVPFLKQSFDGQMEILIKDKINSCYANSIDSLKEEGYSVVRGDVEYDVLIEPGVVRVEIDAPTTVGSQRFARFNVVTASPIYDMVMIATSILQFEAKYGDSDTSAMMGFYPDYVIDKIKRGDGTTLYFLENKIFGNKFQFASRSLVFPAGYFG